MMSPNSTYPCEKLVQESQLVRYSVHFVVHTAFHLCTDTVENNPDHTSCLGNLKKKSVSMFKVELDKN